MPLDPSAETLDAEVPRGRPAPAWRVSTPFDPAPAVDADLEPGLIGRAAELAAGSSRWIGWRRRLLVLCALLGCLAIFLLAHHMADQPDLQARWVANDKGQLELVDAEDRALRPFIGSVLTGVVGGGGPLLKPDALAMQRSPRWIVDDAQRERHHTIYQQLHRAMAQPLVRLHFDGGAEGLPQSVELRPQRRGLEALPAMFWVLSLFALVLYLVAMVVLLARPSGRNLLYALMSLCQSGNLLFMAVESTLTLGFSASFVAPDMPMRLAFDLITVAAIVNTCCLHPRRLPGAVWLALLAWTATVVLIGLAEAGALPQLWWWVQGTMTLLGVMAVALMSWSYRIEPHPFAMVLRRFGIVALGAWVVLTAVLAIGESLGGSPPQLATTGALVWYVFLSSLLLLVPFLARSQQMMREFALLAGISTVATALDLLFVTVFSLGQVASLSLSLFISLAAYTGLRQWILNQLLGNSMLTTERMFERVYRIAREVEAYPERTAALLSQLLRELFEPVEVAVIDKASTGTRITRDGSGLLVPVPRLGGAAEDSSEPASSVMIRFGHRGRRLFTSDDARLTDRIVEQLRRAVAFDKAVEQGRSEERLRLAQDLHDDIGARLLTLMYKAQSPEMEEYVRHTLKDLKTLTRGLAESNHRFSHASAEWKADLTQRLTAAHVELGWTCEFDNDVLMTVVQWSALTRVLRELVSNVISHSQARRVDLDLSLQGDRLDLVVLDDGTGRNPQAWSHGLGLGGVRKRVKQLGGEVEWREVQPRGILCRVTIRALSMRI